MLHLATGAVAQRIDERERERVSRARDGGGVHTGAGASMEEKMAAAGEPKPQQTVIEIFGGEAEVAKAKAMIQEVFDKAVEAKKEQREKEKEWKQKKKDRDRHLYHLRHAKDYEVRALVCSRC